MDVLIIDDLAWLQNWYGQCCEGQKEAKCSIKIVTIDNPGWFVTVNLADTNLENKKMEEVAHDFSEYDWLICWVRDKKFEAHGGAANLDTMLSIFKLWALDLDYKRLSIVPKSQFDTDNDFFWLINWHYSHCNGDWEHSFGVHLTTTMDKPGWNLKIDVAETNLERAVVEEISAWRSNDDWYSYEVKNLVYEGRCGVENLSDILHGFRVFAKAYKQFNII